MVDFQSPDVIVQERATGAVALRLESPSITAMEGTAERGPINRPQTITSPDDYSSVYGGDDGSDLFQGMIGHFANGGVEILVNRIAHYTAIATPATLTAVAAVVTLNTAGAVATSATKTSGNAQTYDLSLAAGVAQPPTLIVSIDGGGPDTATYDTTPSTLTAAGVPGGVGTTGNTLIFSVHSVTQTYTVPAAPPTTATDWALDISAQLPGVSGSVVGGVVVLTTDREGSGADVDYVSGTGTAGVDSGFGAGPTAGVNAGPNDVVNNEAVTAAEIAAILVTDWIAGGGVTASGATLSVVVTTVATGSAASIGPVTGTASTALAFPGGTATGQDAGAPVTPTLVMTATAEGADGNVLTITTLRRDRVVAAVAADMLTANNPHTEMTVDDASQVRVGLQIFIEDTTAPETQRAVVANIIGTRVLFQTSLTLTNSILAANNPTVTKETFDLTELTSNEGSANYTDLSMASLDALFYVENVIGSDPTLLDPRQRTFATDQAVTPTATVDPRPVNVTGSALIGGLDGSAVVDADFVGSSVSKLGLNAYDAFDNFSMSCIPGIQTSTTLNGLLDYALLREDHVAFMDAPEGQTPSQLVTFKNVTANLFGTFGYMNAPFLQVLRQSTGVVEDFPAVGHVTGAFARVDQRRNVSLPAAGIENGQIFGAVGVARDNEYMDKANRNIIYPEGINPIFSKPGRGIVIWGQNTLDPTSDRGAIGVRRAFIFIRRAITNAAEFVLFEQNTTTLRADFRKRIGALLRNFRQLGIIQGDTDDEAFFIICDENNNPASVVNARQFFARVGVNVLPGIDFAIIEIERDTRALDLEIAA